MTNQLTPKHLFVSLIIAMSLGLNACGGGGGNQAPVATAQSITTNKDAAKAITLAGTDSDGTISSYTVESNPGNGTLSGTTPNLTYTPSTNYNGTDSFTFTVTDNGGATSTAATVSITVNAVSGGGNQAPVASAQSITTNEDVAKAITLAGTDSDGTISSYTVISNPSNGALSGTAPNLTYTPTTNYAGSDSFSFTVTDNEGATSTTATVSITVTSVNDAPTATTQSITTDQNVAKAITLAGSDSDGTIAGYTVSTTPNNGVLSGTAPNLTYTPTTNYTGSDSFTFTVTDNSGTTSTAATVSITINTANTAPTAAADSLSATGNTQKTFNAAAGVLANDSDVESAFGDLTVTSGVISTSNGGSVNMSSDGSFVYTPPANTNSDSFNYTLNDNDASDPKSSVGTATITLSGMVWYVDDSAGAGGNGTSVAPFNTLAAGATAASSAETIFVYAGSYTGGITLALAGDLIGEGEGLSVDGLTIPAGTKPTITGSGGAAANTITLANGNTIKGVTITGNARGLRGSDISGLTVQNVAFSNTGGISISLFDSSGTVNLLDSSITNSTYAVDGLNIDNFTLATGILNLIVDNTSFTGDSTNSGMEAAIDVMSSAGTTLDVTITGSSFTNTYFGGVEITVVGTAGGDSVVIGDGVSGNTFTGVGTIVMNLRASNNSSVSYTIRGNTLDGNGLSIDDAINMVILDGVTVSATISDNSFTDIGDDQVFNGSLSDDMVMRFVVGNAAASGTTTNLTITGNTLSNNNARGVVVDAYAGPTVGVTVNNNTFNGHLGNNGLDLRTESTGTTLCLAASGNSAAASSDEIVLEEVTGSSLNVTGAASTAALSANNNGMTINATGAVAFASACTP